MTVFIVGSVNVDIGASTQTLPLPGQTILAKKWATSVGGKGLNQAVACRRLGVSVCFVGCIGGDAFGQLALAELAAAGIAVDAIRIHGAVSTGTALVTVEASGQNTIVLSPGANGMLEPADIEKYADRLATSRLVMLQQEVPHETNLQAATLARSLKVPVCFDPAPVRNREEAIALIAMSDVVTPNETEARELTGIDPSNEQKAHEAAQKLIDYGAKAAVIKLGPRGAYALAAGQGHLVPAFSVKAIDTVAAGDCFNAGFGVALVSGRSLLDAVLNGCAAGALATTKQGGSVSAPTGQDVRSLMEEQRSTAAVLASSRMSS